MRIKRLATVGLATLLAPSLAFAHPHIFAEARLEVVSDDKAEISELRNVWRFDELFSSSVVLDFDKNSNAMLDPDELKEVGQTVLESLSEYNYYTTILDNGKTIKVNKPESINVDYKDGQLLMMFAVKPAGEPPCNGEQRQHDRHRGEESIDRPQGVHDGRISTLLRREGGMAQ